MNFTKISTFINGIMCVLVVLANIILPILGIEIDLSQVVVVVAALFGIQSVECCVLEYGKRKYTANILYKNQYVKTDERVEI